MPQNKPASERLVSVEEKVNQISTILLGKNEDIEKDLDELTDTVKDLDDRLRVIENIRGRTEERVNQVVDWRTKTDNKIDSLKDWVSRIQGILIVIGFVAVLIVYAIKDYLFTFISHKGT